MRLSEAADVIGVTKQTLWRAVKSGKLTATRRKRGGSRAEYDIAEDDLEQYKRDFIDSVEVPAVTDVTQETQHNVTDATGHNQHNVTPVTGDTSRYVANVTPVTGPPAEVYLALIDRVALAERRTVELEILLRQHKNLLTENAESLQEHRAEQLQAQDRAKTLELELESLKTEMSAKETRWAEERQASKPWWRRMFG